MEETKDACIRMYDQNVDHYIAMYDGDYPEYPANQIRLEILVEIMRRHMPARILDIGCGPGVPLVRLTSECRAEVLGFDFSHPMVERGRSYLHDHGIPSDRITWGDAEDLATYPGGEFDAAYAVGVFPHLAEDRGMLRNINRKLVLGGIAALEFRNDLFSLFTGNRYTYDFVWSSLLQGVSMGPHAKALAEAHFAQQCGLGPTETPAPGSSHVEAGYLKRFHNPLTIGGLLKETGFELVRNHFYHYHALPPALEQHCPDEFRSLSRALEKTDDWRGHFLASAFVAEARKVASHGS